jgi:hypothetical protein
MKKIFALNKGMTQAVSHFSRHEDASVSTEDGKYHYCGQDQKNAFVKIRAFYRFSIGTLCAVGILLFFFTAHFGHPSHLTIPLSMEKAAPRGS